MTLLRRSVTGSLPVLAALVLVVVGLRVAQPHDDARSDAWQLADVPQAGPFTIAGSISGLYPGATKPVTLTVTNPNPYGLAITSLTATVSSTNQAGCDAANVTVAPWSGATIVPAGTSSPFTLTTSMLATSPDACQGATFALTFLGQGVRAPLPTEITVAPVILNVPRTQVMVGTLRAVLRVQGTTEGVGDKTLVFYTNLGELCRATTKADGQASCTGVELTVTALSQLQYKVRFLGDATYEPSVSSSQLVKLP